MAKKKTYNGFWSHFDTELYSKILDAKNDVLQIRVNKDVKKKFAKNCVDKGGVTNVLTAFINKVNKMEK